MIKRTAVNIISVTLIVLFSYAAISKLIDYNTFKYQLGRSPYITEIAGFTAWALPVGELIICMLLIFKRTILIGLYLSLFTMLLFTGYIYAMLHFSYFKPCSCGGILSKMGWEEHFWFNVAFSGLSLVAILLYERKEAASISQQVRYSNSISNL
jgi:hypothetical protein